MKRNIIIEKLPEFHNGLIFFNSIQFYLFPLNSFLVILNYLLKSKSLNAKKILVESSKIDANLIYLSISTNLNIKAKIINFLKIINSFGFGEVNLTYLSKKKIIFSQKNKVLSQIYTYLYKEKPKFMLEEIILGFIKNFLEVLLKKEIKLPFVILKKSIIYYNFNISDKIYKVNNFKQFYFKEDKKFETCNCVKLILNKNQIQIKNGIFNIWNMYGIMIPFFFFLEVCSNLNEKDLVFFKQLGKVQGVIATKAQLSLYGRDKKNIFLNIVEQSEFSAMGKINFSNSNYQSFEIMNNIYSHFSKFYVKELNFLNSYFSNNIGGIYETSFEENIEVTEIKNNHFKIKKINNKKLNIDEKNIEKILNIRTLINKVSFQ